MRRGFKFIQPTGREYLRMINQAILTNLRNQESAIIEDSPIIQKAYNIVYGTGAIPVQNYDLNTQVVKHE
jgi:hypothetical protein